MLLFQLVANRDPELGAPFREIEQVGFEETAERLGGQNLPSPI